MIARIAFASALVLAACGDGPSLRVRLDIDATDCPEQPALITLPCSGEVGVWLLDESDRVLEESCLPLERGLPLFGLDDILRSNRVSFDGRAPGERVVIEVGVFDDSFDGCPRDGASVDPLASSFVFGRSEPIEVADGAEANVTLSCVLVDDYQCDPAFTITASLIELQLLTTVELVLQPDETFFAGAVNKQLFEAASVLVFDGAVWSGLAAEPPQGDCFGTELVVDDPSLDPLLSCSGDVDLIRNEGTIEAHYVSPELRATLVDLVADGGPPGIPLLVGRVLDADGTPAENATVDANQGLVQYPNEQFTALGTTDTASHGFFIVVAGPGPDPGCCDDVVATSDPGAGPPRTGHVVTGTVPGHMMTTLIRLDP